MHTLPGPRIATTPSPCGWTTAQLLKEKGYSVRARRMKKLGLLDPTMVLRGAAPGCEPALMPPQETTRTPEWLWQQQQRPEGLSIPRI